LLPWAFRAEAWYREASWLIRSWRPSWKNSPAE
jgi:hypothetical protein